MYAIVEVAGKQYKVENDLTFSVDKLKDVSGEIEIDKVLLYSNGDDVRIGEPYLSDVKVKATVVADYRGTKVKGIKFKKRKGYTRTVGHRRDLTSLKVSEVVAG